MAYRVTGVGTEALTVSEPSLEAAARIASKMEDQGVADVRVFGPLGAEIPYDEWQSAWWNWVKRNRAED